MPVREVEVASVQVAVATENLPMGTMLTKDHIKLVGWPSANQVPGTLPFVEAVVGRGLIQGVATNEPLTESKLAPIEAGAGLSPSIPAGMRAMSVRVNDVVGVAGFVLPGSRVDVVLTLHARENAVSRVVLSNVQVLTAGTKYDQDAAKNGQPIATRVVTLLLTPKTPKKWRWPNRRAASRWFCAIHSTCCRPTRKVPVWPRSWAHRSAAYREAR